jgi:hypothetical protein
MIKFPDSLPMDSILLVINKIKGTNEPSNKEFAEAIWNIVGYAANQTIPEDKTIIGEENQKETNLSNSIRFLHYIY